LGRIIEQISSYIENGALVNIERTNIEEENITGFPLLVSDNLLAMSKIFDFHDEGFLVIRLKEVTDVYSEFSAFYEEVCVKEGLKKRANESPIKDVTDFVTVFRQLSTYDKFISVQCELEDSELFFSIGKILKVDEDIVHLKYFDATGAWQNEAREIPLDKITSVAIEDYYSNVFYKYVKQY